MKEIFKKHLTWQKGAQVYLPMHDLIVDPLVTALVDETKNSIAKGFAPMVLQGIRSAAQDLADKGDKALTVNAEQA